MTQSLLAIYSRATSSRSDEPEIGILEYAAPRLTANQNLALIRTRPTQRGELFYRRVVSGSMDVMSAMSVHILSGRAVINYRPETVLVG
jgi:hypothetical protein